jgi:hypothetical protein
MTARYGGLILSAMLWTGPAVGLADDPAPTPAPAAKPSDGPAANSKARPKLTKEEIARNRAVEKVHKQLRVLKPVRGQPGPNDFFLVGKVEVGADRQAKVEFSLLQGTKPACEEIVSYLASSSAQAARSWRPFARFGDGETAEKGLVAIREKYDQLQAYRAQLMRRYQAKAICRT